MGVLRGSSVHLFTRDGNLWQRYTPRTFGYWGLSLAINLAVGYTASLYTDARPITLSTGIGLLGETIPVALRALRSKTQAPTALPKTTA